MITIIGRVANKRDTSVNWSYVNPTLLLGEIGLDTTVNNFKVGDGVSDWTSLPYWISGISVSQIITPVVAGTTNVTVTIPHPGMTNPFPFFKDASGNEYTGATWQDDGTNIIVTCPDNGSGKSADTFTIIVGGIVPGSGATGTAGGDLSGSYPDPTVATINTVTSTYYDPTSSIQTQLDGKQAALGFTPASVSQVKVGTTTNLFGQTASIPDVGHYDNSGSDNTFTVGAWVNFLSGTGNLIVQLTWIDGHAVTHTKTFYESGDPSGTTYGGTNVSYAFDTKTIRAADTTTIQVSVTVVGTVLFEVGCFINKIVGNGGL